MSLTVCKVICENEQVHQQWMTSSMQLWLLIQAIHHLQKFSALCNIVMQYYINNNNNNNDNTTIDNVCNANI